MKLRWLITKNQINVNDVKYYSTEMNISFSEAKKILENLAEPVLQYFDEYHEEHHDGHGWIDVPTVVEYLESN